MKRILILLLIAPFVGHSQTIVPNDQGSANGLINQLSGTAFNSPVSFPMLDSLPVRWIDSVNKTFNGKVYKYIIPTYWRRKADSALMVYDAKTRQSYKTLNASPSQAIKPNGLNIIYTSPNVTDAHQGVTFDDRGFCYGIASGAIKKRPVNNTGWNFTVQNLSPFTGVPGSLNHLGGACITPFSHRLAVPAEKIINTTDACLDTIVHNNTIIEYDTATLAIVRYKTLDSIVTCDGICATPDGHIWAVSFCDDNYLYEFDSSYTFIAKHLHTGTIEDKQGLTYRPDINSFYVSSNLGYIYTINKTTGQSALAYNIQRNELDAFEGIDWNDKCIKWTRHDQIGNDEVLFISDTKTEEDYFNLKYSIVGIQPATFLIKSNSINGLDTPSLLIQSDKGAASISLSSPGGSRASINYQVGGVNNWFMGAMPNTGTFNGSFDIYAYNADGFSFAQPALLSAKKDTKSVTIPALNSANISSQMINIVGSTASTQTPNAVWRQPTPYILNGLTDASVGGSGDFILGYASNTAAIRSNFTFRKARGTLANPLAVASGDVGGYLLGGFYDGSTFINPAAAGFEVDGSVSTNIIPVSFNVYTGSAAVRTLSFKVASNKAATFMSSVTATDFKISSLNTAPATATSTGTAGEIRFTASGVYICTNTNTWIKCIGTTF